jgi:hypothetical protein
LHKQRFAFLLLLACERLRESLVESRKPSDDFVVESVSRAQLRRSRSRGISFRILEAFARLDGPLYKREAIF